MAAKSNDFSRCPDRVLVHVDLGSHDEPDECPDDPATRWSRRHHRGIAGHDRHSRELADPAEIASPAIGGYVFLGCPSLLQIDVDTDDGVYVDPKVVPLWTKHTAAHRVPPQGRTLSHLACTQSGTLSAPRCGHPANAETTRPFSTSRLTRRPLWSAVRTNSESSCFARRTTYPSDVACATASASARPTRCSPGGSGRLQPLVVRQGGTALGLGIGCRKPLRSS
jgi:hypothetical protein